MLNPAVVTLILTSLLTASFAVYASVVGYQILRHWDITSGSERQLVLERKTYLVSSVLAYLFVVGIFSLFVFIYTADRIHPLFTGAMCAAGALNVNRYGYPALIVKLMASVLAGLWLILNYTDNQCPDYPLIRVKYRLLFAVTACTVVDAYLVSRYFADMKTDIITACCSVLFNEGAAGIAGKMAALPSMPAKTLFFACLALTIRAGIQFRVTGRSVNLFSVSAAVLFGVSMASVISFISLYFYELPTHHCPFCLLQKEYHYIGYPLYLTLLTAGITGIGTGMLERVRGPASLAVRLPPIQQTLCLVSMIGFLIFAAIAVWPMIFSDFTLEGY